MTALFLKLLNMSLCASWLVLAVLLVRLLFRKAPKWMYVLLWGIVALRLVCPLSLESALSLIPSPETVSPEIMTDATPAIDSGIPIVNQAVNPVISITFAPNPGDSANPLQIWIPVAANLWLLGMLVMAVYTAVSYWRLRRRVCTAVRLRENIFQSEHISSPFVLGLLRPKIYLPYQTSPQNLPHVIAHEQAHIQRKDHWWKPLGFGILTLHWFNPLVWLAYMLLCRDIELACDEKVIQGLGTAQRADYSQALLACSAGRGAIAACPLAFGEVGVRERIRSVLRYKKPGFWSVVIAVLACAAVAVCFLTNPRQEDTELTDIHAQSYYISELAYESTHFPHTMAGQSGIPGYAVTEDMRLLSQNEYSDTSQWIDLGPLQAATLTQENFDRLFSSKESGWRTQKSAAAIRKSTARAWTLVYQQDKFYYVLQQENGELYLARGYYDYSEKDDPGSDDTCIYWLFMLSPNPSPTPGTTYVSEQCLYWNPLNPAPFPGGDSGCDYLIGEEYFATVWRSDGSNNIIGVSQWRWQDFPYSDQAWAALYFPSSTAVENIHQLYSEILYQPLTAGKFLLRVDGALWLVELASNAQTGTCIWSIFTLVPKAEEETGAIGHLETTVPSYTPGYASGEVLAVEFGSQKDLSPEDAAALADLLRGKSWEYSVTRCFSDWVITLDGAQLYYHCTCGTFNDPSTNTHLSLTETEQAIVNDILRNYAP